MVGGILLLLLGPVRQFTLGEHILGLREGGNPAAILQARVPSHVIDVQMRAHDVVDVIQGEAGGRQALFIAVAVQHVPHRALRSRLVIADAGIDHDGVLGRLHNVALNAQHELAGGGI
jgi:hypothetical protein